MYGILTSNRDLVRADVGAVAHFLADDVSGRRRTPVDGAINAVACWGDTALVREQPERAATTAEGERATPEAEGHHWGTVCPTDPDYRGSLLDRIAAVGAHGDVRLTTLGFPGEAFCRCDRCERLFAASDAEDRVAWRTETITTFVEEAADRVSGDLVATLYPDPHPATLRERAGLDPAQLAPHVDRFLVPLCAIGYETTYWVESLARGLATALEDLDVPLTIQLSAAEAGVDRLVDVTRQVEPQADRIVFGAGDGEAATIREVIERCKQVEAVAPPS